MDFKLLGNRIREQRKQFNITQEKLAEAVDLSHPYVAQIERGVRGVNIENLIKIASYLKVSVEYLLYDYIDAEPKKTEDELSNQWMELVAGISPAKKKRMIAIMQEITKHIE